MVVGAQEALPKQGTGRAVPKLGLVVRLPRLTRAGERRVEVEVTELVHRLRTHITHGEEEICWKSPFHDEVPGLDVAPLQLARAHAPLQCLGRKRNGPP